LKNRWLKALHKFISKLVILMLMLVVFAGLSAYGVSLEDSMVYLHLGLGLWLIYYALYLFFSYQSRLRRQRSETDRKKRHMVGAGSVIGDDLLRSDLQRLVQQEPEGGFDRKLKGFTLMAFLALFLTGVVLVVHAVR